MSIIPENGKKWETDVKSVGGYRMSIVTTPTGYYKIEVDGPGQPPEICKGMYTNLKDARNDLALYVIKNQATFNKQELIERVAGPKPPRKTSKSKE